MTANDPTRDEDGTGNSTEPDQRGTGNSTEPDQRSTGNSTERDQRGTGNSTEPDQRGTGNSTEPDQKDVAHRETDNENVPVDATQSLSEEDDLADNLDQNESDGQQETDLSQPQNNNADQPQNNNADQPQRQATTDEQSDAETTDEPSGEPDIHPEDVDRVFSVLEEAVTADAIDGSQLDRLLSVLEQALGQSSETDPETLAEFVRLLEELIVEPNDLSDVDISQTLSVLEEALADATGAEWEQSDDVFEVLTDAIRDPTRVDPNDVERFRSGIESAVTEMTGARGLGQLFGFPQTGTETHSENSSDSGDQGDQLFRIARLAAGMTQRATGYSMESGVRAGTRMAYAAANAGSPAELLTESRAITLDELQRAGINVGEEQSAWLERHENELVQDQPLTREKLTERGKELLSQSAELGRDESLHPAFGSILSELAPDEARILRLLATEGPQPTLDVHDKQYIPFTTRLVAAHLSRIGSDAGCRIEENTQLYLTNLERLGLIEFLDDPVDNLKRYQVLEAQPHIEAAQAEAKRPTTTYGSVRLTDLGIEFCETVLALSVEGHRRSARFWDDE